MEATTHLISLKSNKILKSILKWTRSQWSKAKTGVMCSQSLVSVRSWAAAFWTDCNWRREDWSIPTYGESQLSNRVVTNAWMTLSKSLGGRYNLTLGNSLSWEKVALTTQQIYLSNLKALSKITSKFLVNGWLNDHTEPRAPTQSSSCSGWPNTIISVLF